MKIFLSLFIFAGALSASADKNGPCKEIKTACESAGFTKGGHKNGKGLWVDCIDKIAKGETVAGVTVSTDTVAACKAKKENHKGK